MGVEELKWHQLTHNQLMNPQRPHFSPHRSAKPTIKSQISGRMASIGIGDVVSASVLEENPSEEEYDDYDNYYYGYEFISTNDGFRLALEIDFRYDSEARKVMVDFKFDGLYR